MQIKHSNRRTPARPCEQCGVLFKPSQQQLNLGHGRYCSPACTQASPITRLWARVNRDGPTPAHRPELGPCWVRSGWQSHNGYTMLKVGAEYIVAHRYSWQIHFGPIPDGLLVCHACDAPNCVRPDHLFLGTQLDNMRDKVAKGRQAKGETNGWRTKPENMVRGERHWSARLISDQVRAIRSRYAVGGITHKQLGIEYGVSEGVIQAIIKRRKWRHIA